MKRQTKGKLEKELIEERRRFVEESRRSAETGLFGSLIPRVVTTTRNVAPKSTIKGGKHFLETASNKLGEQSNNEIRTMVFKVATVAVIAYVTAWAKKAGDHHAGQYFDK